MALTKNEMDTLTTNLIVFELQRAREKFPKPTNSTHEGFAVLKEEIEELDEEMDTLRALNDVFWKCVRNDDLDRQKETLLEMKEANNRILKEAIQVGAMIEKYKQDLF